jgi:hypothetical protein
LAFGLSCKLSVFVIAIGESMPRKIAGVELIKIEDGLYRTPDGEYEVYRDDEFETECDDPHPCRLTNKMREEIAARFYDSNLSERERASYARAIHGPNAFAAWQEGRKGWYCEGRESHWYSQWVAWTGSDRGWSGEWCDTLTDATEYLRDHLAKQESQTNVSTPRNPLNCMGL